MTMDFDPAFPSRLRTALFGLVVAATSLAALAADPSLRVPVEPFFRHADYSLFKLSPSGKYVAGIVPVDGRNGLVAIHLDTRKPGPPTTVRLSDIGWFEWVNDERLVFTVLDLSVGGGEQRRRQRSFHRQTRRQRLPHTRASGARLWLHAVPRRIG
jgi:hypothetical protein